jgi:hypothetical protein
VEAAQQQVEALQKALANLQDQLQKQREEVRSPLFSVPRSRSS